MDCGYDGTEFAGWATQPGLRTVAGVLGEALARVVGEGRVTGLTVAGRTDTGVHATGQVCHVDIAADAWDRLGEGLVRRLAGLLPSDVRVYRIARVPGSFDARFSALYRRYEYRVADAPWGAPPTRHRDTLAWRRPLDVDALTRASALLVGEHDFAAYCRRRDGATSIRRITKLEWRREPDGVLVSTVEADAFCHSMVRSLVGALLAVGDGRRPDSWPASLLTRRERVSEVNVAPAHGLTLVEVGYPADERGFASRAEVTRRRRDEATAAESAG
jgi:tRNA pseudouridine38-40 synthase